MPTPQEPSIPELPAAPVSSIATEPPAETDPTIPVSQASPEPSILEPPVMPEPSNSTTEEFFNNDDEMNTVNDNSQIDYGEDTGTTNTKDIDKETSEFVSFKIKRKSQKFQRFEIREFSTKYFVGNECVVFVNGPDGTNFDSHSWTDFHGGHGIGKGITTMRCKESANCQLRKKKWACNGLCPGDRFCCKYYKDVQIQICLYIGEHSHIITRKGFVDLRNMNESGNSQSDGNAMKINEEEMDKISDDESSNYFTSDSDEEELQMDNIEAEQIKMTKYEQRIYSLCQQNFEGKEIVMAKHNDIEADINKIYILKRKKNEKISSISRDGYLYQSNTSRKQMPQILHNQGYSYQG